MSENMTQASVFSLPDHADDTSDFLISFQHF